MCIVCYVWKSGQVIEWVFFKYSMKMQIFHWHVLVLVPGLSGQAEEGRETSVLSIQPSLPKGRPGT